jgi:DNA invertase Pin-like site-specific DNA recombinase
MKPRLTGVTPTNARPLTAAIYARVSTEDQHAQMQLTELGQLAARNGWERVDYIEQESTRKKRPVLEQLLKDAKARKFDIVLAWKLDRFGRSTKELLTHIEQLDLAGVRFLCGAIDTDKRNPISRLTLTILAAVAEFERDLIRERTMAGSREYARAHAAGEIGAGKRESRSKRNLPPGRPRRIFRRDEAEKLRALGWSWRAMARHLDVSASTLRGALG